MAKTPTTKTVKAFEHPKEFGFTGSTGPSLKVPVTPHLRTKVVPKLPKNPAVAIKRPGGF